MVAALYMIREIWIYFNLLCEIVELKFDGNPIWLPKDGVKD